MGYHAGTALPLPGSCQWTYTEHLCTGTSETYIRFIAFYARWGFCILWAYTLQMVSGVGAMLHVISAMYDKRYTCGSTGHEEAMHVQDICVVHV